MFKITKYNLSDYWNINEHLVLEVAKNQNIESRFLYLIDKNYGNIKTLNNENLALGTNNINKFQLTSNNGIGIFNSSQPKPNSLLINNDFINEKIISNHIEHNQNTFSIDICNDGSYIIVWDEYDKLLKKMIYMHLILIQVWKVLI